MAERICPPWLGYFLLNPLRRWVENPERMLGPFVRPGMVVLEPGPGMGFFTLPLARMVGSGGRVVAVDVQQKMLDGLRRRAQRAGLLERIELRRLEGRFDLDDLAGLVDFAAAIHVVHEVPDPAAFFGAVFGALKPGGRLLVVEPKGHVSEGDFGRTLDTATRVGFAADVPPHRIRGRAALLCRSPEGDSRSRDRRTVA